LVKGERRRFIRGHHLRQAPTPYLVDPVSDCWIWQWGRNNSGYGVLCNRNAHRVYYERAGGTVPEGMVLDHLCRNRLCVNPAHMEPVTVAENARRGKSAKLTMAQVVAIHDSAAPARALASEHGVSIHTIRDIRRGRRWADVHPVCQSRVREDMIRGRES
jgi:hypothetical protein